MTTRPPVPPTAAPIDARTRANLRNYRIAAYVVGVGLIVLVFIGMPLKYIAGNDTVVAIVGPLHGFLYVVYLLTAGILGVQRRWPLPRLLGIALAGTIPVLSFVAEAIVRRRVLAGAPTW